MTAHSVSQSGQAGSGSGYDHARLERRRSALLWVLRTVGFRIAVKIDRVQGLEHFPASGPAILMMNHIAFLDPLVVMGCLPRHIVPLAKAEGSRNPFWGWLFAAWQVIPVRRGEADRQALRQILQVLAAGEVVLIAPEGTRHDSLQEAKAGIAYVGYRSNVPIIPVALEGAQGFPTIDLRRWRQPGVVVQLGRPFRFRRLNRRPQREDLRRMTDEAMYVLAAMLPAARRGVYADLSRASTELIEFLSS